MLWFAWKIVLLQYRKQLRVTAKGLPYVVICLKNRTFAVSQTTGNRKALLATLLWFAWKIVLLQYRKQHIKIYLVNNWVVICLKNRTFAVSQTTFERISCILFTLWFAWKIVLLQYRKQLAAVERQRNECCDLLEKSYFCSIANNSYR